MIPIKSASFWRRTGHMGWVLDNGFMGAAWLWWDGAVWKYQDRAFFTTVTTVTPRQALGILRYGSSPNASMGK